MYQDPALLFESHSGHEAAIAVSILLSGFVAYVTWRCYESSGEPFLRWLTLGFLGFALVYAPHGILTRMAHHNIWLFLLYGPASRVVMAGFLFIGLLRYGRAADPPEERRRGWLPWVAGLLAVDVAVALAAGWAGFQNIARLWMENGALVVSLLGVAVMLTRRIRSPLMVTYLLALASFAQSSAGFLVARPWNHQWWLAHVIFGAGFFLLSFGVVRAFHTTRSFSDVYSQEEMMEHLATAKTAAERSLVELKRRTDDLTRVNTELLAARHQADSANLAKSSFLAGLSHELRTPLNIVIGFSDQLAKEVHGMLGDPRYRQYATDVRDSGQHLLELINEILDYAKAGAGELRLEESLVDLEAATSFCTRMMTPRAERAGLTVADSVAPEARFVRADERRIRQILLNLLANAVKFTPAGGTIAVTVTLKDGRPTIQVTDTGLDTGMRDRNGALEAFAHRAQAGEDTEAEAAGLPLTRRLVELHGGTLEVRSRDGKGTTVTVRLPADRFVQCAPTPAPVVADSTRVILLAEDDPLIRQGAALLLEEFGYRVLEAANANEALSILDGAEPVDLLFTDIVMPPGMNGAELARQAERLRPNIRVLLTSGFAGHAVIGEEGTERGYEMLPKPYTPAQLRSRIGACLANDKRPVLAKAPLA